MYLYFIFLFFLNLWCNLDARHSCKIKFVELINVNNVKWRLVILETVKEIYLFQELTLITFLTIKCISILYLSGTGEEESFMENTYFEDATSSNFRLHTDNMNSSHPAKHSQLGKTGFSDLATTSMSPDSIQMSSVPALSRSLSPQVNLFHFLF